MNGYIESSGVAAGAEAAPTGAAVVWGPLVWYPGSTAIPGCIPAGALSQQQALPSGLFWGPSPPVISTVPCTNQQVSVQPTTNPIAAAPWPLTDAADQQEDIAGVRPEPRQQQQDGQFAAITDEDAALLDLLDEFEQEQSQQPGSLQQAESIRSPAAEVLAETDRDLGIYVRTSNTRAYIAGQHPQLAQQPQTSHTEQPAASMSAAYPCQNVYGQQQQQMGALVQQYQPPLHPTHMFHPGVAVSYNYAAYPHPQQVLQPHEQILQQQFAAHQAVQQQQTGQQWPDVYQQQSMQMQPILQPHHWAAGNLKQYGETASGYVPAPPAEQSSAARAIAMANGVVAPAVKEPPAKALHHTKEPAPKGKSKAAKKASQATAGRSALSKSAAEAINNTPEQYFRRHVALVDPFWASATADDVGVIAVTHLPPATSVPSGAPASVMHSTLNLNLTSSQLTMLKSKTAMLQLACLLVDDKIPHRCHWPCSAIVTVNGQTIRGLYAAKRTPGSQLKPQQVDVLADISAHAAASTVVKLSYTSNSNGYVLGARLVRKQGPERVKQLMAPELDLATAVGEIQKKLAGDGDVEVCVNAVSLRCPLTAMRIKKPAHFTTAPGLAYFDLDSFLEMTQRSGKWQDPHSSALGDVTQLASEPWLAAIISQLEAAGLADSVEEVEVNPDGCWRPKGAVSDTWFSVLLPPSHAELQAAIKGPAITAAKRKRSSDAADNAADSQRQAKQQRNGVGDPDCGATAGQGDRGCVDLTLDSDEEETAPQQGSGVSRPSTAAAAGLLSRRGQSSCAGSDSRMGTAPTASTRHTRQASAAQRAQQREASKGTNDSDGMILMTRGVSAVLRPAEQGQHAQQQQAGIDRSIAAAGPAGPSVNVDVIVIDDSDSD